MIGGIDVRIPTKAGELSAEISVRAIRQVWPNAVFEDGLTGEHYDHFWQIPFGKIEELFVYRDSDASHLWDAEGAIPDAYNSMIHIILDPGMLTAVVDERDQEMEAILGAIRSGLMDEIFHVTALLEAA